MMRVGGTSRGWLGRGGRSARNRRRRWPGTNRALRRAGGPGFTLIEILVVCGIVALVMTISIPSIYRQLHPESLQRSVREIIELCHTARAQAILGGSITELTINTRSRTLSVGAAAASRGGGGLELIEGPRNTLESKSVSGEDWRMEDYQMQGLRGSGRTASAPEGTLTSAKLPDNVQIEGIRLNFLDYTEDEVVRVRFYPNGTSDEFSLFLVSDKGERRQIFLEVVTALADVETDPMKFR